MEERVQRPAAAMAQRRGESRAMVQGRALALELIASFDFVRSQWN